MSTTASEAAESPHTQFAASSWGWTLACGALKIAIAVSALGLPLVAGRPVAESVGWMLLAGGAAEFALGWGAHRTMLGKVTLGSGLLTILAGILFINSGWHGLFPLTTVSMIWLLLRGMISLDVGLQARAAYAPDWFWLLLRSITDLALGLTLLLGLPMAMIAILLFGETREMVSNFGVLLAISFAVAGVGLVAMAFAQRRREESAALAEAPATA
ncbi:MAG: hypothetical protein JWO81_2954 [Alphaproteobacteria bacterium]|nr:hypothetical protein [Alphaproteobacteria bacterium]